MRVPSAVLRIAGIDPGTKTGVVVIELPSCSRDINLAAWLGSFSISGMAETQSRSRAEGHVILFERIRDQLALLGVREAVIECPVDALPSWGGASGKKSNPATLFSLGANYGLCLAAARAAGVHRVMAYRVKHTKEHAGWMPNVTETVPNRRGGLTTVTHVQKRDVTIAQLRTQIATIGTQYRGGVQVGITPDPALLGEDEVMAYGVLAYHLRRTPLPPVPIEGRT